MEWMPPIVKSGDRRRDAASTRAGRTADWGNHSSLLESTRSFLCFPPRITSQQPLPPHLPIAFLPTIFCSFSASSQEFTLAAGNTEHHRLSPKTHKVPHQTRSAINYLKLKSPSAWRRKDPCACQRLLLRELTVGWEGPRGARVGVRNGGPAGEGWFREMAGAD